MKLHFKILVNTIEEDFKITCKKHNANCDKCKFDKKDGGCLAHDAIKALKLQYEEC